MATVEVVRTFLEVTSPDQLVPFRLDDPLIRVARVPVLSVALAQRLYREVGADYHWVDRWTWSEAQWREWVAQFGFGVWILSYDGQVAGFFELCTGEDRAVEISLLGLLKAFQGRGLGKHLVTVAVDTAWAVGATRVWLHTCTLDDPRALPTYLARGFTATGTERYTADV